MNLLIANGLSEKQYASKTIGIRKLEMILNDNESYCE